MQVLHRFSVVSVCFFALLLASTKGYGHTIIANVAGVGGTITPFGTVTVADNGSQTFTIGPSSELQDVYVDGMSMGAVTSYTFSNVTADHSIIATFACATNLPVRLDSDGSSYSSIAAAYNAAVSSGLTSFTLDLMAGTLPQEDVTFNSNVAVTLNGGFDCSFQTDTMTSALTGSMTIAAGSVISSNMGVSSTPACQPGDPSNFPGNTEICDGLDNNCNGVADEGLSTDADGDGYYAAGSCILQSNPTLPVDCDDHDPTVNPGATEQCDNKDDNCNGQIDEGFAEIDNDGDGYAAIGSCGSGSLPKTDCNDNDGSINPGATEIWGDGIDQNCDGITVTSDDMTDCVSCHGYTNIDTIHTNVYTPDSTCVSCHPWVATSLLDGHYGEPIPANDDNLPVGGKIGCNSCHDPNGVVWPRVLKVSHKNAQDEWVFGNENCDTCHLNRASEHETKNAHVYRGIDDLCKGCHTSDTAVLGFPGSGTLTSQSDVDTLHRSECTLCHTSTMPSVVATITAGMAGTSVNCDNCHVGTANGGAKSHGTTNKTAAHPYFIADANCSSSSFCHVSATSEDRLNLHTDCVTCHASTLLSVKSTIQNGIAGSIDDTTVNCENCHDGTPNGAKSHSLDPAADHGNFTATPLCASCHIIDTALERLNLHTECATCHSSPLQTVITTIANGIKNSPVQCTSCHTADPATFHHADPNAKAGQCTWCHADPRGSGTWSWSGTDPGDNGSTSPYPTQLACATCHVRVVGSTIYIDKIVYTAQNVKIFNYKVNQDVDSTVYYTAPNRLVQHTLTNITAGTINNYGICFSCHNGTTAPAVTPMHAMPSSPAGTARLQNMQYAPGHGTFNLQFSAWSCPGIDVLSGGSVFGYYGTVNYPNLRPNYSQPNISFQQISIPCGSFNDCSAGSTVSVPVLPAVTNATATTSNGAGTDNGIGGTSSNMAVLANDDPYTIKQGYGTTLDVLHNDSDPYGNALTITAVGTPSNGGTVTNNGTSLLYTPSASFTGTETFTYTVTNTTGLTATATVTATVTQNQGPYP